MFSTSIGLFSLASILSTIFVAVWIAPAEKRRGCQAARVHGRNTGMETEPPDNPVALIQRVANGDREAFARLYDRYASLVFTFAMRLLRVRSEAEDLLQEVFLQVWHQSNDYQRERGSPEAWIITMRRSRAIDKLRSLRRRNEGAIAWPASAAVDAGGTVESAVGATEARLLI
jgi:RNA polymerase sigma-70 factor, ECF subfamily